MKTLEHPKTTRHLALDRTVFSEIRREHSEFRNAMARIAILYERDPETAKFASVALGIRLRAHAEAEEATLYAYLLDKTVVGTELDDEIREGIEEHRLADSLWNGLEKSVSPHPEWKAKFRVLKELVEHHLDEEEECSKRWRHLLTPSEDRLVRNRFLAERDANRKRARIEH